jgi:hypothetical protein
LAGVSCVLADGDVGTWSVNRTTFDDKFGGYCIMLRAKITLQFNFTELADNGTIYSVVVPTNAIANGLCDEYITLTFFNGWFVEKCLQKVS